MQLADEDMAAIAIAWNRPREAIADSICAVYLAGMRAGMERAAKFCDDADGPHMAAGAMCGPLTWAARAAFAS